MAVAKWAEPETRSSNLAGTALNSLANLSASSLISYNNSADKNLYAAVTIKLGTFTPSANGSVTLRVYSGDGTDLPDANGGAFDQYTSLLAPGGSAKVVVIPLVRLYPFPLRFQVVNNAGVAFASSGNELYLRPFNEDVT